VELQQNRDARRTPATGPPIGRSAHTVRRRRGIRSASSAPLRQRMFSAQARRRQLRHRATWRAACRMRPGRAAARSSSGSEWAGSARWRAMRTSRLTGCGAPSDALPAPERSARHRDGRSTVSRRLSGWPGSGRRRLHA
jgi:hypothetical protein